MDIESCFSSLGVAVVCGCDLLLLPEGVELVDFWAGFCDDDDDDVVETAGFDGFGAAALDA